jgi:hypothetical protein
VQPFQNGKSQGFLALVPKPSQAKAKPKSHGFLASGQSQNITIYDRTNWSLLLVWEEICEQSILPIRGMTTGKQRRIASFHYGDLSDQGARTRMTSLIFSVTT